MRSLRKEFNKIVEKPFVIGCKKSGLPITNQKGTAWRALCLVLSEVCFFALNVTNSPGRNTASTATEQLTFLFTEAKYAVKIPSRNQHKDWMGDHSGQSAFNLGAELTKQQYTPMIFSHGSGLHELLFLLAFPPNTGAVLAVRNLYSLFQGAIVRAGLQALPVLKTAVDLGCDLLRLRRVYSEYCRGACHKNQQG
jgi:hypothetical protein